MRAVRMNARTNDGGGAKPRPRAASRGRSRPGGKRSGPPSRLRGLRWVPVPLAMLAAVIGALVMGSLQGQEAAANANLPAGYHAGGLTLNVTTTGWMSNDMTGQGPVKNRAADYPMPSSMMPGMQTVGDNRLRVEVSLSNATTSVQRYSTTDFSLSGPGGKTWKPVIGVQEHSDLPTSANLAPGFGTTIDVYFDIPARSTKNLTLKWSRDGTTVSIPVNPGAKPAPMHM